MPEESGGIAGESRRECNSGNLRSRHPSFDVPGPREGMDRRGVAPERGNDSGDRVRLGVVSRAGAPSAREWVALAGRCHDWS